MTGTASTRRDFLKAVGLGATSLVLPGCMGTAVSAGSGNQRPNILWISCEDTSPDLGCYGDSYAVTPNLNRLAAEGTLFKNAFSNAPVCAPARCGIITGMYPTTIGALHMRTGDKGYEAVPPAYVKCFSEYLRAAGYYCTNNVKTDYQFEVPFTAWDECSKKAHWRNRPKGMPFFAVFNLTITHESSLWEIDKPLVHDPTKAKLPPYYPDTPIVRRNWARYYHVMTLMDEHVGRILKQLEDDGLAEDTIVWFWGDHGRGLPRAKRWLYDSGLRVPLIIRVPEKFRRLANPPNPSAFKPGSVNDELISFIDFAPTMLTLTGIDVPQHLQGRNFLGAASSKSREYIFAHRDRLDETYDHIRCVRDKRYKYIRNFEPGRPYAQYIEYMDRMPLMKELRRLDAEGKLSGPEKLFLRKTKPKEELYDTLNDPHEVNNLAELGEYQSVLKRMRAALDEWMAETCDLGNLPEEELIERMWPGGRQPTTAAPTMHIIGAKQGKVTVGITCATEGASIAYQLNPEGPSKGPWLLYTKPVCVKRGTVMQAKATRCGCTPSGMVRKLVK